MMSYDGLTSWLIKYDLRITSLVHFYACHILISAIKTNIIVHKLATPWHMYLLMLSNSVHCQHTRGCSSVPVRRYNQSSCLGLFTSIQRLVIQWYLSFRDTCGTDQKCPYIAGVLSSEGQELQTIFLEHIYNLY